MKNVPNTRNFGIVINRSINSILSHFTKPDDYNICSCPKNIQYFGLLRGLHEFMNFSNAMDVISFPMNHE
jgi:hypothetical protein